MGSGSGAGAPVPAGAVPVDPVDPLPLLTVPASAQPMPPEHEHICSGTHVNPSPQAASLVQGRVYLGTHVLVVVGVHSGAGSHIVFGGHDGVAHAEEVYE